MRKGDESDTGRGKDDLNEQEDELESELHATEDELGAEDEIADEEGAELEGEVTITDEEAQDIIDLADKLKDAVGEPEVEAEVEIEDEMPMGGEAEEEIDLEEPGSRMYEEELYEAALKGLNIEMIDDKAEQRKALVQEAKKRIYERVIRRLLAESKK
jgi:hydroxymethylpyrimidine pyrophosphatase-like HAD family hydrolase